MAGKIFDRVSPGILIFQCEKFLQASFVGAQRLKATRERPRTKNTRNEGGGIQHRCCRTRSSEPWRGRKRGGEKGIEAWKKGSFIDGNVVTFF
jgi:hypothetical protein